MISDTTSRRASRWPCAAAAALLAAALAFAACGGDDDDGGGQTPGAATERPLDPGQRLQTAVALATSGPNGIPGDGDEVAIGTDPNATPPLDPGQRLQTAVALATVGLDGTPGTGDEVEIGSTPISNATRPPDGPTPSHTSGPGETPTVGLDSNVDTRDVYEHTGVSAAVGATFRIAIVVSSPPEPYGGYEYALAWTAGTVSFVGEEALNPDGLSLCVSPVTDLSPVPQLYSGCLKEAGEANFSGQVAIVTLRCDAAGQMQLHTLAETEDNPFGSGLLNPGGFKFATETDSGFQVTCT